jgi:16S rRNA (adenine1518-N6/adenine1519-N6)-dimethyltransferase
MVDAKKYLGQHFLRNEEVCKAIAHGMKDYTIHDKLVEVGPGTGAITKYITKLDSNMSVIEVDGESITYLRSEYPELEIIDFNFLKLDLTKVNDGKPFGLFGNFPYFLSSQILTKIFENKEVISECVGMFQKEVSEKVIATPGNKNYGITAVLLQAFYEVEYLFTVDAKEFDPPPSVQSGVVRIIKKEDQLPDLNLSLFKQVVKLGFNQRRKILRNSLKSILPDEVRQEEIFNKRPEQLFVPEFIEICEMIEKYKK